MKKHFSKSNLEHTVIGTNDTNFQQELFSIYFWMENSEKVSMSHSVLLLVPLIVCIWKNKCVLKITSS